MLDHNLFITQPEAVQAALDARGAWNFDAHAIRDEILLQRRWRAEIDAERAKRNEIDRQIAAAKRRGEDASDMIKQSVMMKSDIEMHEAAHAEAVQIGIWNWHWNMAGEFPA